jgi:hypothetical protein
MQMFREALLGNREIPESPTNPLPVISTPIFSIFSNITELIVAYAALGLFLISLIVTLLR